MGKKTENQIYDKIFENLFPILYENSFNSASIFGLKEAKILSSSILNLYF